MSKRSKSSHELSPVEKDILACYEENQPVLLYGNNSLDLEELIERIKKVSYEHYPDNELIETEVLIKVSEDLFPLKYIDCGDMDGKEVYEALVVHSGLYPLAEGYLLIEHGNLIIDNLHCASEEDKKYYRKLGKIIKDRQIGHSPTTFNWLVAYTNDPEPFPSYFKEQFELILLDGELKESNEISRKRALRHIGKESKIEVEQQDKQKENIFRYKGGRWEVIFDDVAIYPKDKEGFQYISCVLSNPREELHNYRIYQMLNSPVAGSVTKEQSLEAKLSSERSTKIKTTKKDKADDGRKIGEMIDSLDKEDGKLKKERLELENEGSVDVSRITEIEEQLNQNIEIRKSIAQGFSPSGGGKSEKEKIINNVYMNIYRSLKTIEKEHPALHTHFKTFFANSKEYTSYNPDRDILWQTNHS